MKLPFKSIRWRLQAWHGVLLLLVLLAFGFWSYHLARENRFEAVDRELWQESVLVAVAMPDSPERASMRAAVRKLFLGRLQSEFHDLSGSLEIESATNAVPTGRRLGRQPGAKVTALLTRSEQEGFYYVLWQTNGAILLRSGNSPGNVPKPAAGRPLNSAMQTRGDLREQCITAANGTQLLVGRSIATDLAGLQQLAFRMGLMGGVILLLGLAGGWWMSSRAIRPIKDISAAASKIASGKLAERINLSDTDSELGQLAGVLNASFDQVQTAINELQATLNRQVQFTADASHELRTPVSVVLAETNSALARERTPAEYQEALESCRQAARRMRRLTESLLTLARLDSGEQAGKREPCDLQVVAQEAINLLQPLAEQRGVKIQAELREGPCIGDAEQLGQVVMNLVGNAIQYNRPGGEVCVRINADGWRTTVLNVIDTGAGIAAADLPHIFDRFYRADKSRSNADGHIGLGLAITKAIVEAHGGAISVTSEIGSGTTFTVSFKASNGTDSLTSLTATPHPRVPGAIVSGPPDK